MDYSSYLNSGHWKERRAAKFDKLTSKSKRHSCYVCRKDKPLSVHHLTYKRLWDENDKDLTQLCSGCHKTVHYYIKVLELQYDQRAQMHYLLRGLRQTRNYKSMRSHPFFKGFEISTKHDRLQAVKSYIEHKTRNLFDKYNGVKRPSVILRKVNPPIFEAAKIIKRAV